MTNLMPWPEALKRFEDVLGPLGWDYLDMLPLSEIRGRVLAQDLLSDMDDPSFDRSAMDGFAVKVGDIVPGQPLSVTQVVFAEMVVPEELAKGTAAKVMTGAPVPAGADAVIPVEQSVQDSQANTVSFEKVPKAEQHIRRQGECRKKGDRVFAQGSLLKAHHAGLLASLGISGAPVFPRPRVALLSTGPELVPCDQLPGPGQIRESNGSLLQSLVQGFGGEVVKRDLLPDESGPISRAVKGCFKDTDLICLSGAVSMGDKDLVPAVLSELGVKCLFHGVAIKPGKPFWGGLWNEKIPILAFPGNPAAVLVLAHLFLAPVLGLLRGAGILPTPWINAKAGQDLAGNGRRDQFIPGKMKDGVILPVDYQGSGDLLAFAEATHLMEIPLDARIQAGEQVRSVLLGI